MQRREGLPDGKPPLKRPRHEECITSQPEQEQDLLILVQKGRSDVKHIAERIKELQDELLEAQTKLTAGEDLLEKIRNVQQIKERPSSGNVKVKRETPLSDDGTCGPAQNGHSRGKSTLGVPGATSNSSQGTRVGSASPLVQNKTTLPGTSSRGLPTSLHPASGLSNTLAKPRSEKAGKLPTDTGRQGGKEAGVQAPCKETKHAAPPRRESVDLIKSIRSNPKPTNFSLQLPNFIYSKHKRKLRSLVLNPSSNHQCATSALDGVVNLWQIDPKGRDLNFRFSFDCLSPKARHWPEDLTWHPNGESLFAVYSADDSDSQVSILKNSKQREVIFLPDKPHDKGLVNAIVFMPGRSSQFITGGSDHGVVMWSEKEADVWQPTLLHKHLHTSAVYGVGALHHNECVLSAGADKRIVLFDVKQKKRTQMIHLECKAMGVTANPTDFNLYMVHTGNPGQQLLLFDARSGGNRELHKFGWRQDSRVELTALISQSWSPDGLYAASGSTDPKIHIFDIRYNGREPAHTVNAHQKRVFKAAWHHSLPLLLSISSDLNVGLHSIHPSPPST